MQLSGLPALVYTQLKVKERSIFEVGLELKCHLGNPWAIFLEAIFLSGFLALLSKAESLVLGGSD